MSLEDKIAKEKIAADPQINELRMALVSTQKQLVRVKQQREEITRAVTRAVYEAMLAMGPVTPVEKPILRQQKQKMKWLCCTLRIGKGQK